MNQYVIDASVAVEYLLKTPLGIFISDVIEDAYLVAPELIDVEVTSALRRAVLSERIEAERASIALSALEQWPLQRISHRELIVAAWRHRNNLSAYDAFYVALAQACCMPLLTADIKLTRAPNLGVMVHSVHLGQGD